MVGTYERLLLGVGEEVEVQEGVSIHASLEWQAEELDGLGDHMATGRSYASLETLRAFCQGLLEAGCDHFHKVKAQHPRHYWETAEAPNAAAMNFFEDYWLAGGRFLAFLQDALSNANVSSSLCSF